MAFFRDNGGIKVIKAAFLYNAASLPL